MIEGAAAKLEKKIPTESRAKCEQESPPSRPPTGATVQNPSPLLAYIK